MQDGAVTGTKLAALGQPGGIATLDTTGKLSSAQVPATADATATTKGAVQLAGDLGGTSDSPTVPGLTVKQDKASLDADVAAKISDGASASRTALNAAYAPANPALTVNYNPDGTVASTVEDGVTTSYTYNADGTVATATRAGVTRTFTYSNGNVTGAA
ncbi:hypothetical protein [Sinomonas cellulolyticus]|uniref:YD repeat-containing protein n=1 Tax=Sinomonas cellulolyticus TaxID=2801916 RepID=A0ABS1K3L7_9MICC|nr:MULTISPECIES: hypothetical protein [Sinomonas]MBL0706281.1 hypothetical protein [Sinomonas cellulolyticus]